MTHDLTELQKLFALCSKGIVAVGDETRQAIILALMEAPLEGMRVGPITKRTHLSRPAVSHHIKVLRDAGMVSVSRQGTMNYYYLNPDKRAITNMLHLCEGILAVMASCEADRDRESPGMKGSK